MYKIKNYEDWNRKEFRLNQFQTLWWNYVSFFKSANPKYENSSHRTCVWLNKEIVDFITVSKSNKKWKNDQNKHSFLHLSI